MKKIVLGFFTLIFVAFSGAWLKYLSENGKAAFNDIYNGFSVSLPTATKILLENIEYWYVLLAVIVIISFLPLFASKGKWQYLCLPISILSIVALVGIVYIPGLLSNSII